jgi:DNA-binding NarL/FixJ family response regulator
VPGTAKDTLSVVLVDDSEVVRLKLRSVLEEHGIVVLGEASDGETGLRQIENLEPDVVVMDLKMPGMSGIEATWKLGQISPNTPVMVLTVSAEQEDVTDAIMAGARGYVVKGGSDDEIVSTVRRLANGERVVSPEIASEIVERASGEKAEESQWQVPAGPAAATRVRPKTAGNGSYAMPIEVGPPGPAYAKDGRALAGTDVLVAAVIAVFVGVGLMLATDAGVAILTVGAFAAAMAGLRAGRKL